MKKIMFNDKYGLTKSVLEGRKTQTRRIVKDVDLLQELNELEDDGELKGIRGNMAAQENALYQVGEVVAIAQAYKDCKRFVCLQELAGFNNKMFVKAELMPHHIRITDVRIERLKNISDEDCIAEGIAREAYATLIDRISGKATWNANPFVFVYGFELIK